MIQLERPGTGQPEAEAAGVPVRTLQDRRIFRWS